MQKRWLPTAVIALTALAAAVTVVWLRLESHDVKKYGLPGRARKAGVGIPVRTELISTQNSPIVVGATALTEPSGKATLLVGRSTQLSGAPLRVSKLGPNARNGARVKAGELLLELDAAAFEAVIADRRQTVTATESNLATLEKLPAQMAVDRAAELNSAQQEVRFRTEEVEWTKKALDRIQDLYNKRIFTAVELYSARSAYSEAQSNLVRAQSREQAAKSALVVGPLQEATNIEQARDAISEAKLQLALAELDAKITRIVSPIDGFIQSFTFVAGQEVTPGSTVCDVLALDPIRVRVDFPQERLNELQIGQTAEVVLDAFPKEKFSGAVTQILPEIDARLRICPVIIEMPNPDSRIRAGISGFARISVNRPATTVPSVSVIEMRERAMVFVVQDGRARMREVRTGPVLSTGYVEVLDGLRAGEEVVIMGQQYLRDDEPVNTDWKSWMLRG